MTIYRGIGDTLESEKVYYECRKFKPYKQQHYHGKAQYIGKLNSIFAFCVDSIKLYSVKDIKEMAEEDMSIRALKGKVISYTCFYKPEVPKLFQRTSIHKGVWGYLFDKVFCVIDVSLYPSQYQP